MVAEKLSETLGQQVVVQNQGGAGGASRPHRSLKPIPTDTRCSITRPRASCIRRDENLRYDWLHDLVPVSIITRFAPVMVYHRHFLWRNWQGVRRVAQGQSGQVQLRVFGRRLGECILSSSSSFRGRASNGARAVSRPGAAMTDLLTGRVTTMVDGVPPQGKNVLNGRLPRSLSRPTSDRRRFRRSDDEGDGLDYVVPFWTAVYVPEHAGERWSTSFGRNGKGHEERSGDPAPCCDRHRSGRLDDRPSSTR